MERAIFIGDELTATGFRLTGIEAVVAGPEDALAAFEAAREQAELVVMTAGLADTLPPAEIDAALLGERPLLAIVPDVRFLAEPPDLGRRLMSTLGIET